MAQRNSKFPVRAHETMERNHSAFHEMHAVQKKKKDIIEDELRENIFGVKL